MRNTLKAIKKRLDDKEREEKQALATAVIKQAEALVAAKVDCPLIVAELNASSNTKVGLQFVVYVEECNLIQFLYIWCLRKV